MLLMYQPPKIPGLELGRTEEKFADSDANSESVTTLDYLYHSLYNSTRIRNTPTGKNVIKSKENVVN